MANSSTSEAISLLDQLYAEAARPGATINASFVRSISKSIRAALVPAAPSSPAPAAEPESTDETREAELFKAAMMAAAVPPGSLLDEPAGRSLWASSSVREKALMLKAFKAGRAVQSEGEKVDDAPPVRTALVDLAGAVRDLRQWPSLQHLKKLRGSPEFIRLVHAWEGAQAALIAKADAPVAEPVAPIGYISPKQIPAIVDRDDESGVYIPMRLTPRGLFTLALYTSPPAPVAPPEEDLRELRKWLNEEPGRPVDRAALARVLAAFSTGAPEDGTDAALTEAQIERAWRIGFRHACDAEIINADQEWGYKGANVIESVAAMAQRELG